MSCICCGCEVLETYPDFTFHYYVDMPNSISLSTIISLYYPFSFQYIIHESTMNGNDIVTTEVVNICSRNCFLLMENYKQNQTNERPTKKSKLY